MRSKLSPLLPEGAEPAPRGLAATVSGQGAQECLSPTPISHTVGALRGFAQACGRSAARPGWNPAPPGVTSGASQCMAAALFQFLQVWNVSVYHQSQPDSRTSCSKRPAGVCRENMGPGDRSRPRTQPPDPSWSAMLESPTQTQATLGLGMEQPGRMELPAGVRWVLTVPCLGSQLLFSPVGNKE